MPNLRHNVVELLARVPQEVRTPQEKAGLPTLTHATTMCGMMWACTDDGLAAWPVMKLPQSAPPIIMTGILDTTAPSTRPIEHYPPRGAGAMTLLGTTWILMTLDKATTTQPQEVTTGRDTAIHRRRTQSPAHVQVIDLRPMRHVPTEDTDQQTGRRYTHQWVVRGHWRQQPVGPHHSQRLLPQRPPKRTPPHRRPRLRMAPVKEGRLGPPTPQSCATASKRGHH